MSFTKNLLLLFVLIIQQANGQDFKQNAEDKPIKYDRVRLEAVMGLGFSKLRSRPVHEDKFLLSPYSEVTLVLPIDHRIRLRAGVAYQVVGSVLKYYLQNGFATSTRKLPYLSLQVATGYVVSKPTNPYQFEIQGGVFGARRLNDVTINRLPNKQINSEQSLDSSIDYNYGLLLGLGFSKLIKEKNRLGLRLILHQGLADIRTPLAKRITGELSTTTQTLSFCAFYSI